MVVNCVLISLSDEPDCGTGIFFLFCFFDVGFFHGCCRSSICALVGSVSAVVGAL